MKIKVIKIILLNLAILIVLNITFYNIPNIIDITKDKRYSLSDATKNILNNLDNNITIDLFLDTKLPTNFKRLLTATKELLIQYKQLSNNRIHINFVDPFKNKSVVEQEEIANSFSKKGIDIISISAIEDGEKKQKLIVPSALIRYDNKQIVVNLLSSQLTVINNNQEAIIDTSIENLEYNFSIALKQASIEDKELIGFTSGHNELNDMQVKDISFALSKLYNVLRVDLKKIKLSDLLKFKTIIIAKPKNQFSEDEKYKLDQFLMNNNSIILFTSNNNVSNELLQKNEGKIVANQLSLNLDDLLFKYGVKINYDIIQDLVCSPISVISGSQNQNDTQEILPWVYYPLLIPNKNHIITKKLGSIKSEYISTIDTLKNRKAKPTVLLTTSQYNRQIHLPTIVSLEAIAQKPKEKDFFNTPRIVGVLLEGEFNSVFKNRNNIYNNTTINTNFIEKSQQAKLVVISDGNIIKNEISFSNNSIYPLGFDKYTQINYSNKDFIVNTINYISNNSDIVELNAKTINFPLLNQEKIKKEQSKWQAINLIIPALFTFLIYIVCYIFRKIKINSI